jgi:hypothetical protein
MDREIARYVELCERADSAEWDVVVARPRGLTPEEKAFLHAHPPGLVRALWAHFDATRDRCGCKGPTHERAGCTVPLIERLLLEAELE